MVGKVSPRSNAGGPNVLRQKRKAFLNIFVLKIISLSSLGIGNVQAGRIFEFVEAIGAMLSGLYYKQVTIVIYDRKDIGLYYKTRDDHN